MQHCDTSKQISSGNALLYDTLKKNCCAMKNTNSAHTNAIETARKFKPNQREMH